MTMPDLITKRSHRLLTSAFILAGATICPAIIPALAGVGSAIAGVTGGVIANDIVAKHLSAISVRLRSSGETLSNHDLTDAVGLAVAYIIRITAEENPALSKADRETLRSLAEKTSQQWQTVAELLKRQPDGIFAEIEEELLVDLFSQATEDFSQQQVLSAAEWESLLQDWLCLRVGVKLSEAAAGVVARELESKFPQALREVLKQDFEEGGKAFAGLTLSLLGEMHAMLRELQARPGVGGDGVVLQQGLAAVAQLQEELEANLEAQLRQLGTQIQSGFEATLRQMLAPLKAEMLAEFERLHRGQEKLQAGQKRIEDKLDRVLETADAIANHKTTGGTVSGGNLKPCNHWQGRKAEIAQLEAWFADENKTLVGIVGIGGSGKSSLAAKLCKEYEGFEGYYFADVSGGPTFAEVAREALKQFKSAIPEQETQLAQALCNCLQQGKYLLVIDNLETLLDEGELDEFYGPFFHNWLHRSSTSVVLVTTRERPNLRGVRWVPLEGFSDAEGAQFLADQGITSSEKERKEFSHLVSGHPLLLRLVADLIVEESSQDSLEPKLERLEGWGLKDLSHIHASQEVRGDRRQQENLTMALVLDASWNRLDEGLQQLFAAVAALRGEFDCEVAAALVERDAEAVDEDLRRLARRSLLQRRGHCFSWHPVVLAYGKYKAGNLSAVHRRAIEYYEGKKKRREAWETLADVGEYLEIFYHWCEVEEYGEAFDVVWTCDNFLDLRGDNQRRVELYSRIKDNWPESEREDRRYITSLILLGNACYALGECGRAIEFHKQSLKLCQEIGDLAGEGGALCNLGNAYLNLGDCEQALKYYQQALSILQNIQHRKFTANTLGGLGNVYESLGEYGRAIEYYKQSLKILRDTSDRLEEGIALDNLGNTYHSLGEDRLAVEYHEQSLAIAREIGNRRGEEISLGNLGSAYNSLGEARRAIEYNEQSLEIAREIRDRRGEANSLNSLGNAYRSLGEYHRAIEYHEQSLAIKREIRDRRAEANSLNGLGNVYRSLGEYHRAIEYHEQSLAIKREIGNPGGEANSLTGLGNTYSSLGEYRRAIEYHEQSLAIKREIRNRAGEGGELCNLGNAYLDLGDYEQALKYYQQALSILQNIQHREFIANTLSGLGNTYRSLREYRQAIEYHEQSLAIKREIGNRRGEEISLNNLGNAYNSLGEYSRAIKYHEQSLAIAREIGDRRGEGRSLNNLGLAYQSLGEDRRAIEYYEQSLKICQEIGDRAGESRALYNLGNVYLSLKEHEQALNYYQQALPILQKIQHREFTANTLSGLSKTYSALKQFQAAIDCYQELIEIFKESEDRKSEANCMLAVGQLYDRLGQIREGWVFKQQASQILLETGGLNALPYPNWLKSSIRFAQRSKFHLILCFIFGAFAFPFALIWVIALLLWRLLRSPFHS